MLYGIKNITDRNNNRPYSVANILPHAPATTDFTGDIKH